MIQFIFFGLLNAFFFSFSAIVLDIFTGYYNLFQRLAHFEALVEEWVIHSNGV